MYSGKEPAIELMLVHAMEVDSVFEVPLLTIPQGAVPVYDDQLHAVVGYRHETATGVFRLYDLERAFLPILQHLDRINKCALNPPRVWGSPTILDGEVENVHGHVAPGLCHVGRSRRCEFQILH